MSQPEYTLTFRKGALFGALLAGLLLAPMALTAQSEIPRMADGKPDLSGTYDIATLTPMQRIGKFGDKATLTEEGSGGVCRLLEVRSGERRRSQRSES